MWQAYEVTAAKGQQSEVSFIFGIDLLDETIKQSKKVDLLLLLSIDGFTRGLLKNFVDKRNALSPKTIIPTLLSDNVIDAIRKSIRQKTGYNVDSDDVETALQDLLKTST